MTSLRPAGDGGPFFLGLPCPRKFPILLAAWPSEPRWCVGTIFPTDAVQAITGWSATSTTRLAALCSSVSPRRTGKGIAGKWTEYVAPRVMLRICAWVLSHRRLTASTQHNASALREVA